MHPKGAYKIEVACPHTPKSRDTPKKGEMAVFCRFSGLMTPMTLCVTPVMTPQMTGTDSVTERITPFEVAS